MKVDIMILTISLSGAGEIDAVRRLQRMINHGIVSEEDTVRIGRADRMGCGMLAMTIKDFLGL